MKNKYFKRFIVLILPFVLNSCYVGKSLLDVETDGEVGVNGITVAKTTDPLSSIHADMTMPWASSRAARAFDLGAGMRLGNLDRGYISARVQYQARIGRNIFENYSSEKKILPLAISGSYSFPIAVKEKTGTYKIPLSTESAVLGYTVAENMPLFRGFMAKGGLSFSTMNPESDAYAVQKMFENGDIHFPDGHPEGNAILNQGNVTLDAGITMFSFVNTYLSGTTDGKKVQGRRKELWEYYAGVRVLGFSVSNDIAYSYSDFGTNETIYEVVPIDAIVNKSYVGFELGVNWTTFASITRPDLQKGITFTYYGRFGVEPGYKSKYFQSFYGRVGIAIGGALTR